MRRPLHLIPLAFMTLACAQPLALPNFDAPPKSDAPQSKAADAGAKSDVRFGRAAPLPKRPGTIRLAAYNVENLFDDKDDPALAGDLDDIKLTATSERMTALAATIRALDADVLALEEVESKESLLWFRDGYLKDLGYEHVASVDAGDRRGIEQSVLSRIPIVDVKNWPEERIDDMREKRAGEGWATPKSGEWPKRWARSPLEVHLKAADGYELTLFVVHHKSGVDFDAQRELEALQVVEIVGQHLKEHPDENLAVLGDFNATPSKKSMKVYLGSDLHLKNAYENRFDRKAPSETYLTHVTARPIDFIIMSPGLATDALDASFFVLGVPLPPKEAPMGGPKPTGYASDHLPIAIDLRSDVKKQATGAAKSERSSDVKK